jgi:hypothetical protein
VRTWLADEMRQVLDRHLGATRLSRPTSASPGGHRSDRRRRDGRRTDAQSDPDQLCLTAWRTRRSVENRLSSSHNRHRQASTPDDRICARFRPTSALI